MSFDQRQPLDYSRTVIQRLHDVEVNATISSFYDGSWSVKLGDHANGYLAEATVESFEEAERWLYDTARALIFTPPVVAAMSEVAPADGD